MSVIDCLYNNSWNVLTTLVIENEVIISVIDYDRVGESSMWHSVVVSDCNADVGDLVFAIFYVPVME